MRWRTARHGAVRGKKRFLIFPKEINEEWRWLEWAEWTEQNDDGDWIACNWGNP